MVILVQVNIVNYHKVTTKKLFMHKAIVAADLTKFIVSKVVVVSKYTTTIGYFDLIKLDRNTNTTISFEVADLSFKHKAINQLVKSIDRLVDSIVVLVFYFNVITCLCLMHNPFI